MIRVEKKWKLTSLVRNDFIRTRKANERCLVTCKYCNNVFNGSSTSETAHLNNHLKSCSHRFPQSKKSGQQVLDVMMGTGKGSKLKNFKFDHNKSHEELAKMVIKHESPFSVVEYDHFHMFVHNL